MVALAKQALSRPIGSIRLPGGALRRLDHVPEFMAIHAAAGDLSRAQPSMHLILYYSGSAGNGCARRTITNRTVASAGNRLRTGRQARKERHTPGTVSNGANTGRDRTAISKQGLFEPRLRQTQFGV